MAPEKTLAGVVGALVINAAVGVGALLGQWSAAEAYLWYWAEVGVMAFVAFLVQFARPGWRPKVATVIALSVFAIMFLGMVVPGVMMADWDDRAVSDILGRAAWWAFATTTAQITVFFIAKERGIVTSPEGTPEVLHASVVRLLVILLAFVLGILPALALWSTQGFLVSLLLCKTIHDGAVQWARRKNSVETPATHASSGIL